jgi:hypothetical protein
VNQIAAAMSPMIDAYARIQKQIAEVINSDVFERMAAAQANFYKITEQLTKNIDFAGIAAQVAKTFAAQQLALTKNLAPAIEAMRAEFYPPNIREVSQLRFQAVNEVVMADGIALYGLPRKSTAEALVRANSTSERREVLGRRWRTISADCREVVLNCTSGAVAQYVPFALAALDALDVGHTAAAQALTGSLIDAIVAAYFGNDRYKYTPSSRNRTTVAYNEFTIREFIAFAPMWQAYQQFFVSNGDKVPATFSRNATAHTVSARQFNRRNATQGLMLASSLLYRLDEESKTAFKGR